jgi:predicted patatin/cPLA2 family phospholipase
MPDSIMVVQGGGMRASWIIGALDAMNEAALGCGKDFRNSLLAGIGSSAGAMNLGHFGSGHTEKGIEVYTEHLTDGNFIPRFDPSHPWEMAVDLARLAKRKGRPVDVDYLVDDVLLAEGPLTDVKGRMAYYAVLTDAETGQARTVPMTRGNKFVPEIYEIYRATGALPVLYDKVVEVAGGRYVDGGVTSSIPLDSALALEPKPKHILALLTYEHGNRRPPRGFLYKLGVSLFANNQSDAIKELIIGPGDMKCNEDLDRLESPDGIDPRSGTRITLVQPSNPDLLVGRTTTDRDRIVKCVKMGREDMKRALEEAVVPAAEDILI